MSKEVIPIFFDTSCLYAKQLDRDIFSTHGMIGEIIQIREYFDRGSSESKILVIIPEIVIRERKTQRRKDVMDILENFKRFQNELKKVYGSTFVFTPSIEDLCDGLDKKIQDDIDKLISANEIGVIPPPSPDCFNEIIELALEKKTPFNNDGVGFKDALIWFSIRDYLMKLSKKLESQHGTDLGEYKCNRSYLFTNNQKDFMSDVLKRDLESVAGVEIRLVLPRKSESKIKDIDYSTFLMQMIGDNTNIQIESVTISLIKSVDNLRVYSIITDPFPSDISPFLKTKTYSEEKCEEYLNANVKDILKSLNFKYDMQKLDVKFERIPDISAIYVYLDFHNNGQYYDVSSIEVEYWDGEIIELGSYFTIMLPECIQNRLDQWGDSWIEVRDTPKKEIIGYIEEKLDRKVDPELIEFRE